MSFAFEQAFKIVVMGILVAACLGLAAALLSLLLSGLNMIDPQLDAQVIKFIGNGRGLVNNFVNPKLFNLTVGLWLAAYPVCFSVWLTQKIWTLVSGN